MVRLKVLVVAKSHTEHSYFNSTMVRLKVIDPLMILIAKGDFNSTMVRLKAVASTTKKACFTRLYQNKIGIFQAKKVVDP